MQERVFTNAWFSVLYKSRNFDVSLIIKNNKFEIIDSMGNYCEFDEKRFNQQSSGFNGFEDLPKKIKP